MFTPGFIEGTAATLVTVSVLFAWFLPQVRERQRQNAELEAEQRAAEAGAVPAE